jgi:type I restriction-modification system DNA methylase subunit
LPEVTFKKIFSNGPYSLLLKQGENTIYGSTKSDLYNIVLPYNCLEENGLMVVTTGPNTLLSFAPVYNQVKDFMVNNGLKAVIYLPPLWSTSSVGTNLLVLEKGYTGPIKIINATELGIPDRLRRVTLYENDIKKVVSAYYSDAEIENFSAIVPRETIIENKYDLKWSSYITFKKEKANNESIEELKKELKEQYDYFKKLID